MQVLRALASLRNTIDKVSAFTINIVYGKLFNRCLSGLQTAARFSDSLPKDSIVQKRGFNWWAILDLVFSDLVDSLESSNFSSPHSALYRLRQDAKNLSFSNPTSQKLTAQAINPFLTESSNPFLAKSLSPAPQQVNILIFACLYSCLFTLRPQL
jgi:hypothetical protein